MLQESGDENRVVREMYARTFTELDRFFLARLERFARIALARERSDIVPWRRLAQSATLSAFRDCADAGLVVEAREILSRESARR